MARAVPSRAAGEGGGKGDPICPPNLTRGWGGVPRAGTISPNPSNITIPFTPSSLLGDLQPEPPAWAAHGRGGADPPCTPSDAPSRSQCWGWFSRGSTGWGSIQRGMLSTDEAFLYTVGRLENITRSHVSLG